jgi:hypothetical protein
MRPVLAIILICASLLTGCATTNQQILEAGNETQLQKRSYQSRVFETSDKERVLRATISTLQDLGFIIERADLMLGSVSATKQDKNVIRITVSVRQKGDVRMLVRANAQFNITPVEDPIQYQNFFSSLEKSLFLVAHAGE